MKVKGIGGDGDGAGGEACFVVDTRPFTSVTEGQAEVLFPTTHDVFYNPVQEFNRDLSVAVLRVFAAEYKRGQKESKRKAEEKQKQKEKEIKEEGAEKKDLVQNGHLATEQAASEGQSECKKNGDLSASGDIMTQKEVSEGRTDGVEGSRRVSKSEKNEEEEEEEDSINITIGVKGEGGGITNKERTNKKMKLEEEKEQGQKDHKESRTEATLNAPTSEAWRIDRDVQASIPPPGTKDEEGIRILEGLAASGLRSIRYAREVGGVKEVVANDISYQALECMRRNIEHNKVEHLVTPSLNDASMVMYKNRAPENRFHAIDLDPYGSPHAFLDGAVQSVSEGGVLLVTCTDMAVLCGNSPETCYAKYGALSLKSKACHEMALRIVLQCLESHANRYGRYIVPLLSLSADFYVRVVVRVFTSKAKVKETFTKVSHVYQCVGCETMTLHPLGRILVSGKSIKHQVSQGPPVAESCAHCGHRHVVGGPVWSAPIHDRAFLRALKESLVEEDFATYRRMLGTLTMMEEELPDVPLYYVLDRLARVASINLCKMVQFRSALLHAGYRVSLSHADRASLKTDAPANVVWDIVRAWERQHPANKSAMAPDRPAKVILEKRIGTEVSFELHEDANPESRKKDLLRFQMKPEKFWGPKSRAKTSLLHDTLQEKRIRKQGKKRRHSPAQQQQNAQSKHPKEDSQAPMHTPAPSEDVKQV